MIKVDEKFKEIKEQNLGEYADDYLVDSLNHNTSMDFGDDYDWIINSADAMCIHASDCVEFKKNNSREFYEGYDELKQIEDLNELSFDEILTRSVFYGIQEVIRTELEDSKEDIVACCVLHDLSKRGITEISERQMSDIDAVSDDPENDIADKIEAEVNISKALGEEINLDEIDSEDLAAKLKGVSPEALRGFSETTQDVLNIDHDLYCEDLALSCIGALRSVANEIN